MPGFLDLALEITTDLISVPASLHALVPRQGPDTLLELSFNLVADSLGMGLGVGGLLGRLGLRLLLGAAGGQGGVSDSVSDGLLCGANVGVGGVCESVGHFFFCWCVCVLSCVGGGCRVA